MDKILEQLASVLASVYGWLLMLLTAMFTFIQPEKWSFVVVGGAIMADLTWGIIASIKKKRFLLSSAFKETFKKIAIYSFSLIGVFAIEKIVHADGSFIAVKTVALLASVCELWSMSASMLIVKPNMPFLRIFRGQLKGEIASKVSKNVNINEILKDDENNQ